MNCATHSDIAAVAFCRTCGKPLCQSCTRDVRGVIYCETCLAARIEGTAPAAGFIQPAQPGFTPVSVPASAPQGSGSGPNPAVAGILGAIPFGIGAVYNGQYAKGLAHLFIFAMLIYGTNHAGSLGWLFGIAIPFFVLYQIIDAVKTARAIQTGQPAPDPFGLSQSFGGGEKLDTSQVPMGAVILIGLGLLFLFHTMGFWEFGFDRFWPIIIIALGGWMVYRNWERPGGCRCTRCRTRGLMGSGMVLLTGILLLLNTTDIAGLDRTWPAWLLAVGVIKLVQSTASSEGHIGPLPPAPPNAPPPPAASSGSQQTSASGEVSNV